MKLKGLFAHSKWTTKAILLMGIPVFFMLFSSVAWVVICHLQGWNMEQLTSNQMLWSQAFQSAVTFVLGAWLYVYLISPTPARYLGIDTLQSGWLYVVATLAMFALSPLVSVTALWNDAIELPASLQAIEQWMRNMEEIANDATLLLLQGEGAYSTIMALVVMAFIPAVGEEFLFRGCLQKGLQNKIGSVHLAVGIAAFVFSFIHFQFYGFIPRFILGIALGYFYVYGKSLWIPIWAHFLNNATAVLSYKWVYQETAATNLSTMGAPTDLETNMLIALAAVSALLYVGCMSIFVVVARNRQTQ